MQRRQVCSCRLSSVSLKTDDTLNHLRSLAIVHRNDISSENLATIVWVLELGEIDRYLTFP